MADTQRKTKVTTPSDREIATERVFDAPRERVFAAFTDPELIPEWWARAARRSSRRWTSGAAAGGDSCTATRAAPGTPSTAPTAR